MEKITTNNLISTPNIEGNIGSCTSQSIEVNSGRTLFIQETKTIVTNSCTGEVKEFNNWGFTGTILFIVMMICFSIVIFISVAINSKNSSD